MKNCQFHNTLTVKNLPGVFMGGTRTIPKFRDLGLRAGLWRCDLAVRVPKILPALALFPQEDLAFY